MISKGRPQQSIIGWEFQLPTYIPKIPRCDFVYKLSELSIVDQPNEPYAENNLRTIPGTKQRNTRTS